MEQESSISRNAESSSPVNDVSSKSMCQTNDRSSGLSFGFLGRLAGRQNRHATGCNTIGIRRPHIPLGLSQDVTQLQSRSYLESIQLNDSASSSASHLWNLRENHLSVIVDAGSDSEADEIEVAHEAKDVPQFWKR
mmetsp:Transcript_17180/g.26806  ORF Transcript_17180/g.26806 Transcript_17180/m.26806 type:complete len:136 (+) Transcript_17180:2071-2478(+)